MKEKVKNFLSNYRLIGYGFADMGLYTLTGYTSGMSSYFLTDIAMLSTAAMGVIDTVDRLFTFLGAALVGALIDRCPFKSGKYLPWLKYGAILMVVGYLVLFALPLVNMPKALLAVLILIASLVASAFDMTYETAYSSSFAVISTDPGERTFLGSVKSIGRETGELLCGVIYPLIYAGLIAKGYSNQQSGFAVCAVLSAVCLPCLLYTAGKFRHAGIDEKLIDERRSKRGEKPKLSSILKNCFTNKPLMMISIAFFLYCFRHWFAGPWRVYYYKYVLGNVAWMSVDRVIINVAGIVIIPIAPFIAKKIGDQKKAYILFLSVCALGHFAILFFGYSRLGYMICYVISQIGINAASVITLTMFAAACDAGKKKTGTDSSGLGMAMYSVAMQASLLVATAVRAFLLNAVGYVGGMEPTPYIQNCFVVFMSILPAAFVVAGIAILLFVKLEPAEATA